MEECARRIRTSPPWGSLATPAPGRLRSLVGRVVLALLLSVGFGREATAQISSFGKNKIQYASFQWEVMRSPHFHLHFYPAEEALARTALAMAESSYTVLSRKYRHEISEPIPLIIYSAHAYFEQTNIIPQFLPEGVGGFTDFMRSHPATRAGPCFRVLLSGQDLQTASPIRLPDSAALVLRGTGGILVTFMGFGCGHDPGRPRA